MRVLPSTAALHISPNCGFVPPKTLTILVRGNLLVYIPSRDDAALSDAPAPARQF
jgi:hypothetical protein